jgi:hypothetical protein
MSLPKQLIDSFTKIKLLPITEGNVSNDTVCDFVNLLNKSIPSSLNTIAYTIYRFNRTKYILDKKRFINDIKGCTQYESMILWTDYKDILSYFGLENKIFLGWDKVTNQYRAFILNTTPSTPPPSPVKLVRENAIDLVENKDDSMDNEMNRVYNHMYSRIREINLALQKSQSL